MPDTVQLVTVGEAAAVLGLSQVMVRRLAKTGQLQGAYKKGSQWLIPAPVTYLGRRRPGRPAMDSNRPVGGEADGED